MTNRQRMILGFFVVGMSLGCSSQADSEYRGEVLARVKGQVIAPEGYPDTGGPIDAAILWTEDRTSAEEDKQAPTLSFPAERVRVGADFPWSFTLDILSPPPPEVYESRPEVVERNPDYKPPHIAYGLVAAVAHGDSKRIQNDQILGVARDSILIYFGVEDDDPESDHESVNQIATMFEVPATKGFHLARLVDTPETEAALYSCLLYCAQETTDPKWFDTERCLRFAPQNPVCLVTLSDDEDKECYRIYRERRQGGACPGIPWQHVPNPEDLEHPVTIQMGATFSDWYFPNAD